MLPRITWDRHTQRSLSFKSSDAKIVMSHYFVVNDEVLIQSILIKLESSSTLVSDSGFTKGHQKAEAKNVMAKP